MLARKILCSAATFALTALAAAPAWSVEYITSYNEAKYFDNIMSLDSDSVYDPSLLPLDELNAVIRDALGPLASIDVLESSGAMSGEHAVYDLSGGSVGVIWHGENENDAVKSQLVFTGLVGDAEVDNTFSTHSLTSFDFGPLHSEDLWTTSQQTKTRLRRRDAELTFRHDLNENFGWVTAVRFEEVRADYTGRLQTMASTNLINSLASFVDAPLILNIVRQDGAMRGDMRMRMYTVKGGLQSMITLDHHRFSLAALLQYSHAPEVTAHAVLTPNAPDADPIEATVKSARVRSAGVDLSLGYSFHFIPDHLALDLRYRTMAYFPVSKGTQWDDPRVNHGLYAGLTAWFGR